MRMVTAFILLAFLLPLAGNAQKWSFGIFAGGANYNGDLSKASPVFIEETNPSFGVLARHNFTQYITVKGSLTYGRISGDDANNEARAYTELRNLSFRSDIYEASLQGEINILGFDPSDRDNRFALYLSGGISVYRFNPQSKYEGEWVDLQPLATEGQGTSEFPNREKYSLTQVSFPVGGGIKYALDRNWVIGIDAGVRRTLTDYLDDVSRTYAPEGTFDTDTEMGRRAFRLSNRTWDSESLDGAKEYGADDRRGNSSTEDWYMFGGLTLTYTISDPSCQTF